MKLLEVNNPKRHKAWLELPYQMYRDDPVWIPPLRQDVEKIFDPKSNKAFEYGTAIRWLLVDDQEKPIGRVAAFTNSQHPNPFDYPTGGMGFFECINDQTAANMLFDRCKQWLQDKGMEAMDGPINFGEKNEFWGLLIYNFEDPPTYAFNYNPPYYLDLFNNYGFQLFYEQWVYHRTVNRPAEPIYVRKANILLKRNNITVTNVKGFSIDKIADDFLTVYNEAWGTGHEGFKPMKRETAHKLIKSMKPVMDPRIVIFAYQEDRPIGFFVCIPELNEIFKYVNGNLNWWGKLKFLWYKKMKPPRTMYGLVFGVVPDWQGKGVEGAIVVYASDTISKNRWYDDLVMTWIGDFNPKMVRINENLGATVTRKYATFRYLFDRDKPFERHPVVGRKESKAGSPD